MVSDHYPLTASTDFSLMASLTEETLRKEGFRFVLNKTKEVVEFEIEKPAYFRIVVQKRKDPEVGNFLLPSIKAARGCHVDLWLSIDSVDTDSSFSNARKFFRSLVQVLPASPWEGLKFRETGKERKRWKELLD